MYDFTKTKFHCSSISNIMATGKAKSAMQIYREAVASLTHKQEMYEGLKNKNGSRGAKYATEIAELTDILIPKLEVLKDADEPLSTGCKNFLTSRYSYEKYGKWSVSKDIGSRETQKGKEVEPEAISMIRRLDGAIIIPNIMKERLENDWFTGVLDAYEGESLAKAIKVHDVKSPWDAETFFCNLTRTLPYSYYWQMQGYMDLTGAPVAEVHFCLINTPERFMEKAAQSVLASMNLVSMESPEFKEALKEIENNMKFDDMPLNERRIKFVIERNDEDIELARKRVEKCRIYLQELQELHLNFDLTVSSRKFDVSQPLEVEEIS